MSLSKTNNSSQVETENIIFNTTSEEVAMGVNLEAMTHIISRLTDMYTDPISATVREVVSNALDATALVPEDERKTIKVTTPTLLNPSFIVQDWGVGMSLDTVKKIYSQYGASTKGNDFTQIGAYGLGAKAPLSYCTEFTVETTRDGITTLFKLSRKENGNFTKILSSVPTKKPNGTLVTIPVRMGDKVRFDEALNSYRHYSLDSLIEIDGQIYDYSNTLYLLGEVVLDEDSGTTGRIFMKKEDAVTLISNSSNSQYIPSFGFILSGWFYMSPLENYYNRARLYIELKPGVLDFSSGRDSITKNARFDTFMKNLKTNIAEDIRDFVVQKSIEVITSDEDSKKSARILNDLLIVANNVIRRSDLNEKKFILCSKFSFEEKDFTLSNGFNPITSYLNVKNNPESIIFGIKNDSRSKKYSTIQKSEVYRHYDRSRGPVPAITEVSGLHNSDFFDTKNYYKFSFAEFFHVNNSKNNNSRNVYVITGVNKKNHSRVSYHKSVIKNKDSINSFILLLVDKKRLTKSEKEYISLISDNVVIKTADEFISEMNDWRKNNKTSSSKPSIKITEPLNLVHVPKGSITPETIKDGIKFIIFGRVKVTIEDIMKNESFIFLSSGNSNSDVRALYGAINSGIDLSDKDIYVEIGYSQQLMAAHFNAIKNYDNIIISSDFNRNSVSFREIRKTKVYDSIILDSELKDITTQEIFKNIFDNMQDSSRQNIFNFIELLRYSGLDQIENNDLKNFIKTIDLSNRKSSTFSSRNNYELRLKYASYLTPEYKKPFEVFNNRVEKIDRNYYLNFESSVLYNLMSFMRDKSKIDKDSALVKEAIRSFVNLLNEDYNAENVVK